MATYSAGEASVKITPDFRKFLELLRKDLAGVEAALGVEIRPDTTNFAKNLEAELEKISAKLGVEINPDTSTFAADLAAELEKISAAIGVEVNPDTAGFAADLDTELAGINRSVSVDVEVSDTSLTAAEQKIKDRLSGIAISVDVDADTSAAVIQLEAMRAAYSRLTMDVDANTTAAGLQLEALRAANETHTMDVDADTTAAAAQIAALQSTLRGGGGGGRGGGLGGSLLLNAGALGIAALPAAASMIASIGADVQTLTANIALMPGLFAGAAAGAFTLSVGLDNMKDAFSSSPKKAAKAYEQLSAEGKQLVDTLKGFGDRWDRVKDSVQDTTLSGLSEPMTGLINSQLPALEKGMTGVAGKFNTIAKTAIGELSSDKSVAATATIFGDTEAAAGKLNGAVLPIINSIRTLSTTGSSFLPRLADSFVKAATAFDSFITKSNNSGQLWGWMDRGITSAGQLMSIIGNLGSSLSSVFRAQRGEGDTFLTTVDKITERMATWLKTSEGQAQLRTFFQEGADQLDRWKPILGSIGSGLKTAYDAAQAWSGILLPFLTAAAGLLTSHDGVLKTLIISYLAFRTIAPIFGAIQAAVALTTARVATMQAAMASTTATSTMGKGLVGLGALLGPAGLFGIGIVAAAGALTLLAQRHQDAANAAAEQKRKLEELRETLDDQTGAVTTETRMNAAKDLENRGFLERAQGFGVDTQEYVDAGLGLNDEAKAAINARLTESILANLPTDPTGKSQFKAAAGMEGMDPTILAQALQGVPEAVTKFEAAAAAAEATGARPLDLAELKAMLNDVAESAATLGGEMNGLDNNTAKAGESQRRMYEALNGTFGLTEEGTNKFRELGLAVINVPDSKTVLLKSSTNEEMDKLRELGYIVERLPDGTVKVSLDDAAARAQIVQLTKPTSMTVAVDYVPRTQSIPSSVIANSKDLNYTGEPKALGGPIMGGTAGKDSVPILGMPGEHMLTTSDVDKLGGQGGVYRFRSALQAGLVKPMAKGGAVEWTEKNEIDLQQAQTAVTQAEENAAKVEAKAGASEADKRQAQLKIDEARYKAQQLQNKKDGTSSATVVAPQASLPGRASSKDLERADAENAVDQANAKRNQVYNDPASTDAQKAAADRAYQKAQNSLESTNKDSGSSEDGLPEEYTAQGIGSAIGSALATGLLSFLGLENSIFSSSNTYNKAFNSVVDHYSGEDSSSDTSPSGDYSYTPKEVAVEDGTASSPSSSSDTPSSSEVTYNADGGVQQWSGTFGNVLTALAMPSSWLSLGLAQMATESGGNPKAINNTDSNAAKGTPSKGLMQVIDPTFNTHRSSRYPADIWDPSANIAASLLYTQSRYGSPVGVWGQGHGYKDGGWVSGPGSTTSDSILAPFLSNKEFVVNAAAAAQNGPLLEAINAGNVPSLPAGFGSATTSSTSNASTNHDRSVNYYGDNYVMNPDELFRQQDRHVEQQSIGHLAAFS